MPNDAAPLGLFFKKHLSTCPPFQKGVDPPNAEIKFDDDPSFVARYMNAISTCRGESPLSEHIRVPGTVRCAWNGAGICAIFHGSRMSTVLGSKLYQYCALGSILGTVEASSSGNVLG